MSRKISIMVGPKRMWAFKELMYSMRDALIAKDFEVSIDEEGGSVEDFNIHMGYCYHGQPLGDISIYYEVEHAQQELRTASPVDYSVFTRSLHWFDYKEDLRYKNIYYCPIGYSKHFDTTIPSEDLRPVFHMGRSGKYGFRNEFRRKFNLWTTDRGVISGEERDKIIMTSIVNVNSRIRADYAFTPLHASLIVSKGKLYMQDDCGKDDYDFYKPYMVLFTEQDFKEKLNYWITHSKERKEFEQFAHEGIKKHKFADHFYAAIGDLLEQYR